MKSNILKKSIFLFVIQFAVATTWAETVDLATVTTDKSLQDGDELKVADGDVLTGKLSGNYMISIASNATVTLNEVTINGVDNENYQWAGISCEGSCNIILAENTTNYVRGFYKDFPGIFVPVGSTLTISGTGTLTARNNKHGPGAGIGGGNGISCGNITISGGSITAIGGDGAAGIGGGRKGNAGNIVITGGTINARGGSNAAGIGGGNEGDVENIEISGNETEVTVEKKGDDVETPYSIGKGKDGSRGGTITINGVEISDIEAPKFIYTEWIKKSLTHTDIVIASIPNQTYTGSAIWPDVIVKDGETQLIAGVDYTVECTNNVSVGQAQVVISGMGANYKGSISKTFEITPKEISIAWDKQTSFVYNGTEQAPTATAEGLINGDICTIIVSGAKNVGSHTAKAVDLSNKNYKLPTENLEKTFEITQKGISVVWDELNLPYSGMEQSPTVTAEGIVSNEDCTITVSGAAKDIGSHTATATVICNDNYKLLTENLEKTFKITQREISIAWGELAFFYNGTEQAPTATVKGLLSDDDCSVTVSGAAKDAGAHTVTAVVECKDNDIYKLPTENLEKQFFIINSTIVLDELNDYTVQDGDVLTGTLAGSYKISIADGATVMFNGVTINGDDGYYHKWAGITCLGDCNIILAENSENKVKGFYHDYPGIYVPENKTLTISGTGSLEASSNGYAAGIGCGYQISCGNITISEGSITATGGHGFAGIGGGNLGSVGDIVISGGVIDATGGPLAAGIGGGGGAKVNGNITNSGNITISGGIISASGGTNAAGIGFSKDGKVDANIEIGGDKTKVTARRGEDAPYSIGSGSSGSRTGTITIGGVETQDIEINEFDYTKWKLLTHTDITIADITDQTYAGSAICPNVVVKDGETTLELSVDYAVECTDNISAGTAKMTITGMGYKGNSYYAGSITKTFEITPKEITISWDQQASFVYNGTEQAPTATVGNLVSGDECSITVSGAKDVGSHTATATKLSNDNYMLPIENLEKTFEITPKEITISWDQQASFVYNGTEQAPTATAEGLVNGDECTITVSGAKDVGSHTATATELSNANYKLPTTGLEQNFEITKATLTVTAKNKTIAYGDEPANDGVEYSGFVGEENASVLGGTLTYGYNYKKGNKTGEYTITPSGLTSDNYEINFVSGTLTVEAKKTTFAAIQVFEDEKGKRAEIAGEYDGPDAVNITEDIKNVAVTFNREFTPNSGHATIMFPFDVKASSLTGVRSVIEFDGIKTDKNDNKMVGMRYVWCNATLGAEEGKVYPERNCNNYSGELKAYTPYMIEMDSPTLGIKDAVTLKSNSGKIVGDAPVGNWVFRGTLQKKEWPKGTGIINEGRLWAFSAAERSGAKIGEFVQFGGNNWANPFRAYLVECKKSGEDSWDCQDDSEPQPKASQVSRYRFADALAPTNSAEKLAGAVATDEPLVLRQAAASETASLNSMDIVIVYGDKDSDGDMERPTVIGRFNPATGEIRMLPRTKQTYDLKGRKVGNGKKAKGAYYNRR